jgi:hypothetical protein
MDWAKFAGENPVTAIIIVYLLCQAIAAPFRFGYLAYKHLQRHKNIAACGWPPEYLDADGDIHRPEKEEE